MKSDSTGCRSLGCSWDELPGPGPEPLHRRLPDFLMAPELQSKTPAQEYLQKRLGLPDQLPDLSVVDRLLAERRLRFFIEQAWPIVEPVTVFVPNWHIDAICDHLEATLTGGIRRLIINIPPRFMKSLITSVMFPAWAWTRRPALRFLISSYAQELSTRDSLKTRRLIYSRWYQQNWGSKLWLSPDQAAKTRFENNHTGYRISTRN